MGDKDTMKEKSGYNYYDLTVIFDVNFLNYISF